MAETSGGAGATQAGGRVGHFRWVVCALLFFATTVNYIDRQVLGILAPELQAHHRLERGRSTATS